nr:LysR substrate-binding domain-containing protein [Nocardioides flavescens]
MLVELSRLGSMHEVAAELATTTSTVSQGIATLGREVGAPLVERAGRRVRLTPAGQRLAEHAVTILAAVDAARLDLDPAAEPAGVLRVAGFATAVRRSLLPAIVELTRAWPRLEVRLLEHEPAEALDLLGRDDVDLVLAYDYDLAPAAWQPDHVARPLWSTEWGLGVLDPTSAPVSAPAPGAGLPAYAESDWIVNSRHTADETALRALSARAGFTPRVVHRIDSLELVHDLVLAGRGVALLPLDRLTPDGLTVLPLADPPVLRAFAVTRRGRDQWAPLRAVLDELERR